MKNPHPIVRLVAVGLALAGMTASAQYSKKTLVAHRSPPGGISTPPASR